MYKEPYSENYVMPQTTIIIYFYVVQILQKELLDSVKG